MTTVAKDWDASNALTMNTYSVLFVLTFLHGRLISVKKIEKFVFDVIIGVSGSDVIDRFFFDVTIYSKEDLWMLIATIVISSFDVFTKYNVEWAVNGIMWLLTTPIKYLWRIVTK